MSKAVSEMTRLEKNKIELWKWSTIVNIRNSSTQDKQQKNIPWTEWLEEVDEMAWRMGNKDANVQGGYRKYSSWKNGWEDSSVPMPCHQMEEAQLKSDKFKNPQL